MNNVVDVANKMNLLLYNVVTHRYFIIIALIKYLSW